MTRQLLNMLLLSAFCWLFCISSCQAEEKTQALNQLQSNLTRLEQLNNQSKMELSEVKIELKSLREESAQLKNELSELRIISTKQEYSLSKANRLLEDYKKEMDKKIRILKMQRTLAYVIMGMVAIALI